MADEKQITEDCRCPHCGVDLLEGNAMVTWEAATFGRGWLVKDDETGEVYYSGKSSADHEETTGFYCSECQEPISLPDGMEAEWS